MIAHNCVPRPSATLSIKRMVPADVSAVVQVHLDSFLGFFLTFLGPAFLRELYVATLTDSSGISFVAEDGQGICGFVAGTAQPSGFYRRLLRRRWWRFALAAVLPVLKRPSIIARLLRAFSMPGQVTQQEKRGTLMSIAVLPEAQGRGIGQALVKAFLEEATRRCLRQVDLTTDRNNNEATNRFYQNLGFSCESTFTTSEGRVMNEYVVSLPFEPSDDHVQPLGQHLKEEQPNAR
jgi:ribosomal protein S18 acetylase RimI-like enzyme